LRFHVGVVEKNLNTKLVSNQCEQIGQNFATWATLGDFLLNQFSPAQAVSINGLL